MRAASAVKHLNSRDLGVSLCRYAPNLRSPMAHSHKEQEEAYVVVAGSGRILLDDEIQELRTWDVIRVDPEVVRAFEAGPDGLDVIAVGAPSPRRVTASGLPRPGRARSSQAGCSAVDLDCRTGDAAFANPSDRAIAFSYRTMPAPRSRGRRHCDARARRSAKPRDVTARPGKSCEDDPPG